MMRASDFVKFYCARFISSLLMYTESGDDTTHPFFLCK